MTRRHHRLGGCLPGTKELALCAILLQGAIPGARAAEPTVKPALEEIVVTAQKREEKAQDVPIAINVFDEAALARIGFTNFGDLNQNVPSLSITPYSYGSSLLEVFIRGVGQTDVVNVSRDPGVGIYLDDVYIARSTGLTMDLGDVERVEVLRGPQGTLYGRNTIGGAVKFITAKPTGQFGLKETLDVGNLGYARSLTSVNLPEYGHVSAKLTFMKSNFDGWVTNPGSGGDFGQKDQEAYRAALAWHPSDAFVLDYVYDHGRQDGVSNYMQHGYDVPTLDFPGVTDTSPLLPNFSRRSWRGTDVPQKDNFTDSGHALTATWTLTPTATLKSVTSYRQLDSRFQFDTMEAFNLPEVEYYTSKQHQFSEELVLAGASDDLHLKYNVGAFYFKESANQVFAYIYNLFITHKPSLADIVPIPASAQNKSDGLYTNLTWTPPILAERLDITLGGRYSRDTRAAVGGFIPGRGSASYKSVDPSATIDYRWSDDVHTYVKYSRAYRAGGFNIFNTVLHPFNPERLTSYELGMKSMWWEDRLRLNLDVFTQDYKDIQVDQIVFDPTLGFFVTVTKNLSKARYKGVEGELELLPVEHLRVSSNVTYMQAETVSGIPQPLPNAPKWKGNADVEYSFDPFSFGSLSALVGGSYQGNQLSGRGEATAGYGLVNARLTLSGMHVGQDKGGLSIALWGQNLVDRHYIYYKSSGGIIYGEPRTFGINAVYSY